MGVLLEWKRNLKKSRKTGEKVYKGDQRSKEQLNSRGTKSAIQCVIVSDMRENNKEIATNLRKNGEQLCHPPVKPDVCSEWKGQKETKAQQGMESKTVSLKHPM